MRPGAAGPGWPCLRAADDGCVLDLSIQPNAKKTQPDGLHDGALLAWLAAELRCPKRDVVLLRGEASRRKQVQVALPEQAVATWLDRVLCP